MTYGSSGACIDSIDAETVCKTGTGDYRVYKQGSWLLDNQEPPFPEVHWLGPGDQYAMERLSDLPRAFVSPKRLAFEIFEKLDGYLWRKRPVVELDQSAHIAKVYGLIARYPDKTLAARHLETLMRTFANIDWGKERAGLTHGDPTLDNIMLRGNGDLVITDPIPASPEVPDLTCVDIGKVLQSLIGYERVRYPDRQFVFEDDLELVLDYIAPNVRVPSLYWCAVHLLRTLPYVPEEVQSDIIGLIDGACGRLRS